jgi:hypothetical protein
MPLLSEQHRILYFSPVPTHPPYEGNRERLLQIVGALRDLGVQHQFFCYVRIPPIGNAHPDADLRAFWGKDCEVLAVKWDDGDRGEGPWFDVPQKTRWTGRLSRILAHTSLGRRVCESLQDGDAWFAEGLSGWVTNFCESWQPTCIVTVYPFLTKAFEAVPRHVRKIIDAQDVFTDRNRRLANRGVQANWLSLCEKEEARLLGRADQVIAIQPTEASHFARLIGADKVTTVTALASTVKCAAPSEAGPVIGLLGSSNPFNVAGAKQFIDSVWPLIRRAVPDCRLRIAGSLCEALSQGCPGVDLVGPVSDKRGFYEQCRMIVNPCVGGTGLKIKSIEALTYGRALATTADGAVALEAGAGQCVFLYDNESSAAECCRSLVQSPELADRCGAAAREFVESMRAEGISNLRHVFRL